MKDQIRMLETIKRDLRSKFLKKWLVNSSENGLTIEKVNNEYENYSKSLKWQLIENEVLSLFKIEVSESEAKDKAKELIRTQMMQYGAKDPDIKEIEKFSENILSNKDQKKKIYDQIFDSKTLEIYKKKFKLIYKDITYNDFVKLASKK